MGNKHLSLSLLHNPPDQKEKKLKYLDIWMNRDE